MGRIRNVDIIGVVEATADCAVAGWAFSRSTNDNLELTLLIDGSPTSTVLCNLPRPDVAAVGHGREDVGFQFRIPNIFCDGLPHLVEVHYKSVPIVHDGEDGIPTSEWEFMIESEYTVGQVDTWQGSDVHCWAIIHNRVTGQRRPADSVSLKQNGSVVFNLVGKIFRPDVARTFDCDPYCGFVLPRDELSRIATNSALHFIAIPTGQELIGSPLSLRLGGELSGQGRDNGERDVTERAPDRMFDRNAATAEDPTRSWISKLRTSALFDQDYYLRTYPDIAGADMPPFEHFLDFGCREGRRPNPYFDPAWYQEQNPQIGASGIHPLLHYYDIGDQECRNPGPLFDVRWYKNKYSLRKDENALSHYLVNCTRVALSPIPAFDAEYYAENNPDVVAAKIDLFQHYYFHGYREHRNPSSDLDVKFYVQRHMGGDYTHNPIMHFWASRHLPGVFGKMPADEVTVSREIRRHCKPGPHFEEISLPTSPQRADVHALAYYLPQFHSFPENDQWWGTGFTEWTNLVRGSPRFIGHYQPRTPRDLGFYDLSTTLPMKAQINLARRAGITTFVFYYYWFNGKRLMDGPVNRFLGDKSLDIGFALMWANENWTRRWDGAESEVLIGQDYQGNDDITLIQSFYDHFTDERYFRIAGRPILMIYRADVIPECRNVISRWRGLFKRHCGEDPIFVMAQAFNSSDPLLQGFDGAIEFPPHKLTAELVPTNADFVLLDNDFNGTIHRYDDVVRVSLDEGDAPFPLIKTVVPSWDNDPRRQGSGLVITGSTPAKYEAWLAELVRRAKEKPFFGQPIVCINAWNEWCEGAYLEPDVYFGGAYLNATSRALVGRPRDDRIPRLVLIGHDAFPGGAQHLLLNLGSVLRSNHGIEFEFILLGSGDLLAQYAATGPVMVADSDDELRTKLAQLHLSGYRFGIVNTSASARTVSFLNACGMRATLLVHELPRLLRSKGLAEHTRLGLKEAETVIFPAKFVRDSVLDYLQENPRDKIRIIPQGSYNQLVYSEYDALSFRRSLGIELGTKIILGVGYGDLRKGFDLFVEIWRALAHLRSIERDIPPTAMVWVGAIDPHLGDWLQEEIAGASSDGTFIMAGYRTDMAAAFSAASVFCLTSREDPLPTVVLEALSVGVPVVAFERAGGIPELLATLGEGHTVAYGDTNAMLTRIVETVANDITPADRLRRADKIAKSFSFDDYAYKLLCVACPQFHSVSVIILSFNYEKYAQARLSSVLDQTYPVQDILVLDDASSDGSTKVFADTASEHNRKIGLDINNVNSGSVFNQWAKGALMATGEFVWIAEADDLCDPTFLARMTDAISSDHHIQFVFSDSQAVDEDGCELWTSYKEYYRIVSRRGLDADQVFSGREFVNEFLSVRNVVVNASAVLWRKSALQSVFGIYRDELDTFRMAGDWFIYLAAAASPDARIAYVSEPLNIHRRHTSSVTHTMDSQAHVREVQACHEFARRKFQLPPSTIQSQEEYIAELRTQLGATGAAVAV